MARVPVPAGRTVEVQPLDARPLRYVPARNLVSEQVERLGASMAGLADSIHDLSIRRAEYDAKDGALELSDAIDTDVHNPETGLLALRGKAAVDAYPDVLKRLTERADKISSARKDPRARQMFDDNAAARLELVRKQIGAFIVGQRQAYEDEADLALIDTERNDAGRAWADDEQAEVHLATGASIYARMANRGGRSLEWAQNRALEMESGARRDIALARTTNLGPDAGEAYFKRFEGVFSPEDARSVQSTIRIRREALAAEERRVAAEARAAAAAERAQERERLETLRTQLETGAGSSADWVALAEGYGRIGDTSGAASARAKAAETRAAEKYRGASLPTIERDIAALEAREGKLSPTEASTLNGLRDLRQQTVARLNEPGGALRQEQYATGTVPAALDLNDADSFKARANAAIAAARNQGGRVEPLFADDIRRLEGYMQGEASERLKALRTISNFSDPRAIEGAARQLTGAGDGDFRIAATLVSSPGGEKLALEVLRGRDALATSEKAFSPSLAQFEFNRMAAPALAGMPPDYSRDVFDAARNIYAERARQKGQAAWDATLWRGAINAALGGDERGGRQYGGVVRHRDRWVSIPPGWTANGVFRRIATMSGPDTGKAAITDAPTWPDGSKVTVGQIRELTPVRLGGTRYGFQTRGGRLLGTKSGRPYTLDVAKLPWKK